MLEPSKFKNQELAMRLLDLFNRSGIDDKYEARVANIRKWEDNENGYDSLDKAYQKITDESQDFSKKGTLNFTVMQFKKTDYNILGELYEKYQDERNVLKALSYYIATELKNDNIGFLNQILLTENYIDQITKYIEEYRLYSRSISNFLHTNNKHRLLAILEER
jgi:hypothetical protein